MLTKEINNHLFFEIMDESENNMKNKISKKIKILFLSLFISTIILIIFLCGYFKFGWFQKSQDNIIHDIYLPNQVLFFQEKKKINTEIFTKNGSEKESQNINNNVLVTINSKKKLNYFGEINYLYNAYIVILTTEINGLMSGGLDITDQEIVQKFIDSPNSSEHPVGKFSFYENGTIDKIYISNDTSVFYATAIIDLIEQIIPRISKKLYNKKNGNIEFSYHSNENMTNLDLIENHHDKVFKDKYFNVTFNKSKTSKIIKRKIINDTIEQVNCESEFNLNSEKTKKHKSTKDLYDIGLYNYIIKISSNLNKIKNKSDKDLLKTINLVVNKLNYKDNLNFFLEYKKAKEKAENKNVTNEKNLRNLNYDKEKKIFNHTSEDLTAILDFENYKVDFRYSLINFELFDHKFEIEYILYSSVKDGYFYNDLKINIGNFFHLTLFSKEINLLENSFEKSKTYDLLEFPFYIYIIPVKIGLQIGGTFKFNYKISKNQNNKPHLLLIPDVSAWLCGYLKVDILVLESGVEAKGNVIGLKGQYSIEKIDYIQYNLSTLIFSGELLSYKGPFSISAYLKTFFNKTFKKKIIETESYPSKYPIMNIFRPIALSHL